MERWIRVLLLTVAVATLSGCATVSNWFHHRREAREERAQAREDAKRSDQSPDDDSAPPRVVDPAVERRKITVPRIRSSNIEFGLDYGALVRTICERGLHRERPSTLDQWALAQRLSGIGVQGESPELELFAVGQR